MPRALASVAALLLAAACAGPPPTGGSPPGPDRAGPHVGEPPEPSPPASPPAPELHLVAVRADPIDFHVLGDRLVLVATVPYPVGRDGAIERLDGVERGLPALSPDDDVFVDSIAGGFTGPGDGWLVLRAESDHESRAEVSAPLAHAWQGSGWEPLREPHGEFTRSYTGLSARGDTVFATAEYSRLRGPRSIRTDRDADLADAPASARVRLRGRELEPREPDHVCARSAPVSDRDGNVYSVLVTCDESPGRPCERNCLPALHTWAAGSADSVATPLPDLPAGTLPFDLRAIAVTPAPGGVLVAGAVRLARSPHVDAYLALGAPGALRRIVLDRECPGCDAPLRSAALAPDGAVWLVLGGALFRHHPAVGLRPVPLPALAWPDLAEWAWDRRWQRVHADAARTIERHPVVASQVARVGDDVWIRLGFDLPYHRETITAVLKTGPHRPPEVLPSVRRLLGELRRRGGHDPVVRLLAAPDEPRRRAFEADLLPRLRARDDIAQVYLADTGDIVAVVDDDTLAPRRLAQLGARLDVTPEVLPAPPAIARMIWQPSGAGE